MFAVRSTSSYKCLTSFISITWPPHLKGSNSLSDAPPSSNCGKWRFIGILYFSCDRLGGDCRRGGAPHSNRNRWFQQPWSRIGKVVLQQRFFMFWKTITRWTAPLYRRYSRWFQIFCSIISTLLGDISQFAWDQTVTFYHILGIRSRQNATFQK